MRNNLSDSPSLRLQASQSGLGDVVNLNGFIGHVIGEESADVLKIKFLITNSDGSPGVVISTIHRKYIKVVNNGKNQPNST
jgi:hypothetical protein